MDEKTIEFDKQKIADLINEEIEKEEAFVEFKTEYFPDTKVTIETMEELSNGKGDEDDVE